MQLLAVHDGFSLTFLFFVINISLVRRVFVLWK